ncbi:T9SS type A sorting domain-containing protein [bacterium]|nr:T9SS type A sorting domain-containing protein [bacterium]
MKNIQMRFLQTLIFLFILCFITSCIETKSSNSDLKSRIQQKHEPSDEFFLQRMGPDGHFALDAYSNALNGINQQTLTRTINGFDNEWTTQGPGNIGARINTVKVNPTNENIIFVGFSDGGVFKTTDGGVTWNPIFDEQAFLSIGDIELDPQNPEIVYVGTGDLNVSGYPFIGDGLHRSIDGGVTWANIGLEETRIISKIIIDPTNSNNIFTATMGLPFQRGSDRGVYRSNDNGNTWEQVLFISDSTGVSEMVMDPNNPQVLYAVGWDRIRNNFESLIKGEGAKVYKTIDGGDTWNVLEGGLPNDIDHSRMGITICESNPSVLYVQYVAASGYQLEAIYKTEDAGISWDTIPIDEDINGLSGNAMGGFGWYFGKIRVNPNDPNDIYLLGVDLWRTVNGGENWSLATPPWWYYDVHADKHDLTFLNNGGVLLGTDGGLYRYNANNDLWEDIENIPTTQFYRVAYSPHQSDLYYGGAQDNGSMGGNEDEINNWARIFGGDGFQMAFDPDNSDRFFVETQRGNIGVTLDGGISYDSGNNGIDDSDRRNWDMPYIISPHTSQILYTGTYRVYYGEGDIPEWNPISEDLTDGADANSRYNNITAIDESPIEEGLLYAGTGDGNVWRGDNVGTTWTSISDGLPDQYVTDVISSPSDVNVAYVTYSGYRDNDFLPRIFKSENQGGTWEDISSDLPDLAINELLIVPETGDSVMFVATDGGVYGTVTAGTSWERLGTNMPIITVYDLVINEDKNELVAGTFARSIMTYPLDSIFAMEDTIMVSNSSPKRWEDSGIKIIPTIATHYTRVKIENTEPNRNAELIVISIDGKLMYQASKLSGNEIIHDLDISNYPTGQYFVKVKIRHKVMSSAFVKQ